MAVLIFGTKSDTMGNGRKKVYVKPKIDKKWQI